MFNAQDYVASAVKSVQFQTLEDWELVLFDDGSRDRTLAVARQCAVDDQRIRVIEGTNGGTASARNRGYAATSPASEFVIFLDNDDTWEPGALESLVTCLEEHPEFPAAHGLAQSIDPQGQSLPGDTLPEEMASRQAVQDERIIELPASAPTSFEALLVKNYPLTPGTTLVRRELRERIGGFVPETVPCDDWDMNLRIARYGGIALVDQVVLNWRRHPDAASHTTTRWRDAYLLVRKRSILSPENAPSQRTAALSAFRLESQRNLALFGRHAGAGRFADSARSLARWLLFQRAYWQVRRAGRMVHST